MKRKTKKGFSLIEILVAVTVFAIAIAMVASITTSSLRAIRRSTANKRLNSVVRDFNNLMANKVRSSELIKPQDDETDHITLTYSDGSQEEIELSGSALTFSETNDALPNNISISKIGSYAFKVTDGSKLSINLNLSSTDGVETDYVTSLVRRN